MAKNSPRFTEGYGFPIAAEALDLELYLLACGFAASSALSAQGKLTPGIGHLRRTFELSEVSRRLLAIAVTVRSQLDHCSKSKMKILNGKVGSVGELMPDAEDRTMTQRLDLREACNKIIHSLDVDFEFSEPESEDLGGLLPRVTLHGDKFGKPWTATLDVYAFIAGAYGVT
jgi:hypothetical protein